jgi:hypothetical protein
VPPPDSVLAKNPLFGALSRVRDTVVRATGTTATSTNELITVVDRTYMKALWFMFAPLLAANALVLAVRPSLAVTSTAFATASAVAWLLAMASTTSGLKRIRVRDVLYVYLVTGGVAWNNAVLMWGWYARYRKTWFWKTAALHVAFPVAAAIGMYASLHGQSSLAAAHGASVAGFALFAAASAVALEWWSTGLKKRGSRRERSKGFASRYNASLVLAWALYAVHRSYREVTQL